MGLIGAQGSAAAQAQIQSEGEEGGHQARSSDGGHADPIEFRALVALQSRYGLEVALNVLEAAAAAAAKAPGLDFRDEDPRAVRGTISVIQFSTKQIRDAQLAERSDGGGGGERSAANVSAWSKALVENRLKQNDDAEIDGGKDSVG
ncbi:hypothetical protein EYF80_058650 [Liparis tanakae]|uniref:Uncharacterized protein n=1 Tax=Liparis tanakae TaxID=230148 RepID=A0A4Z2EQS9_9TELE|nr:hypothetical protein EYF80_058650 [Liparis tanakae]